MSVALTHREIDGVPWAIPIHPVHKVNQAAQALVSVSGDLVEALEIVNNWRSSHSYPLNAFTVSLKKRIPQNALIAQRLKRLDSIVKKLKERPTMKLSQMQDVGGCRAVVESVESVRRLRLAYLESRMKHTDRKEDDYLAKPRESGYRAIHLIYRYHSEQRPQWNGLKIEIQMRSRLQHAWAMAVETISTMLLEPLKASQGSPEWLEFLKLTSSAFAIKEGTVTVPGTPTDPLELKRMITGMEKSLRVEPNLSAYKTALKQTDNPGFSGSAYFLLQLNHKERLLTTTAYRKQQIDRANEDYQQAEKRLEGIGAAVLVSVGRVEQLRRAFPSYYQDTELFLKYLKEICG